MSLVWFLLIGLVAGWLAGMITKGRGFGIFGNMVVGILGALIGGYLFNFAGISGGGGLLGSLITALAGAIVLLILIGLIRKAS